MNRRERFLSRPGRAYVLGIALLGVTALMSATVPLEPLGVDRRWSESMKDIQSSLLTDVALIFNALGRGPAVALLCAAVGILLLVNRRWLALVAFAATEAVTSLSSTMLKILIGRPRPPDGLVDPVGSSFPSGHAAYAGATCLALVLLFTTPTRRRRLWWALAALVILGMAWSRTYLQVHWFSDVVGGSLLGIGIAITVFGGALCFSERLATSRARSTPLEPPPTGDDQVVSGDAADQRTPEGSLRSRSASR